MVNNDITLRLRMEQLQSFLRDAKSGKRSIDEITDSVKKLDNTAKHAGGHRSGMGIMSTTMMQAKYAAAGMILSLGAAGVAVARIGLSATSQLEQSQMGYTVMLKSKAAAKDLTRDLIAFADWTPFNTEDVNKWAQSLIGVGAKKDQIIPTLTAVGDVVSAMGGSADQVNGAIVAIEQIAAKAKLSSQELNQLAENRVFARDILAKGLHTSTGELMSFLDKGGVIGSGVAIPIILRGLEQQYKGMMRAQSQTIGGLWSTFKDKLVGIIRADPDSPFSVALRKWLQQMIDDMPKVQEFIRAWFTRAWDLGAAISGIASQIKSAASNALSAVQSAGASGGAFGVGQLIGGSVPTGASGLFDQLDKWAGSVDWFDIGKTVGQKAIGFSFGLLTGLFDVGAWWDFLKKHWWDAFLVVLSLVPVGKAFGVVGTALSKVPILKAFAPMFNKLGSGMVKAGGPIWKALRGLGGAIFRAFEREFPEAGALARTITGKISTAVKTAIPNLFRSLKGWLGPAVNGWLEDGFAFGFRMLSKFGAWVRDNILVKWFTGWGLAIGGAIVGAFTSGWDAVKTGAAKLFEWLGNGFYTVVNNFIDMLNGVMSVQIAGHTIGPQISHVGTPGAARGGEVTEGGLVEVGEAGREILALPRGAKVYPSTQRTSAMAAAGGGVYEHTHPIVMDGRTVTKITHRHADTMAARR